MSDSESERKRIIRPTNKPPMLTHNQDHTAPFDFALLQLCKTSIMPVIKWSDVLENKRNAVCLLFINRQFF